MPFGVEGTMDALVRALLSLVTRGALLATLLLSGCASLPRGATIAPAVNTAPATIVLPTEVPAISLSPNLPSVATATPTVTSLPSSAGTLLPTPMSVPSATRTPPLAVIAPASTRSGPVQTATPAPVASTPLPPPTLVPTVIGAPVAALATSAAGPLAVPAGVLRLTGRERGLYAAAIARGRPAGIFTIAGDSNSEWAGYLGQIALGAYDLRSRPAYAAVAARFGPSFQRRSVAVAGGLRAADMFLADWPDKPSVCDRAEGRFACELRLSRASIVFIQLGTGDRFVWAEYEGHIRRMLEMSLQNGVLPVLVTKADDLESWQGGAPIDHMNTVIRRLAAEYQVPMIDFHLATRNLPIIPNPQLPDRPFTKNGLLDEWGYYFHLSAEGKEMRILTTLAMLAAITN